MNVIMQTRRALPLLALFAAACLAQDPEWMRAYETAQCDRPKQIAPGARIAPATEPGTPLLIHGRVVAADGKTALPGVVVFAYQTDRTGVYDVPGSQGWRLRGWAKTDAQGRFEFRTIRPGSYPAGRTPAHVHLSIEGPGAPRQWAEELRFADDPFVGAGEKRASETAGPFGNVRPVTVRDGVQHVDFTIRVDASRRF